MLAEQTCGGRRESLSQANKLSRTHVLLVEALNRHRGKGQQKVTVEHVHAGGKAIVGAVSPGGEIASKSEEQPNAKQIADAPQPEMRSTHEIQRAAVPISGDAERPLPDSRREVAGSADGE